MQYIRRLCGLAKVGKGTPTSSPKIYQEKLPYSLSSANTSQPLSLCSPPIMSRKHSVNRPPTPDVQDDDDGVRSNEPTFHEIANVKLIESGEKERLMELARERLVECGWKDEMKALCWAVVKKNGRDNVTVDDLVRAITPKGRASIPDSVKAELLQKIRTFMVSVAH